MDPLMLPSESLLELKHETQGLHKFEKYLNIGVALKDLEI